MRLPVCSGWVVDVLSSGTFGLDVFVSVVFWSDDCVGSPPESAGPDGEVFCAPVARICSAVAATRPVLAPFVAAITRLIAVVR